MFVGPRYLRNRSLLWFWAVRVDRIIFQQFLWRIIVDLHNETFLGCFKQENGDNFVAVHY